MWKFFKKDKSQTLAQLEEHTRKRGSYKTYSQKTPLDIANDFLKKKIKGDPEFAVRYALGQRDVNLNQEEGLKHNDKVKAITQIIRNQKLPILPLNTIHSPLYKPDIVTRIRGEFLIIDLVNSRPQAPFDIGGLMLTRNPEAKISCVAVISEDLWQTYKQEFCQLLTVSNNLIDIIAENNVSEYLINKTHSYEEGLSEQLPLD